MDNTRDRIWAASLFLSLSENEQKEEIQKLGESNELLGKVSIYEPELQIDSNYRARIFAELLSQLSPDSEYPTTFVAKFLFRYEQLKPEDGRTYMLAQTRRRSPIVRASLWQESEPSESDSETAVETVPRFGGTRTKREVTTS
ncbi:hypothetical protein GH714_000997 [Hevea brasiliensis]|uniref:Uncharacterized protein n=1 Tax=Hevea brasiliensis TaxID=3981 RepID=A0A6A6N660_HEVBR|nr:hypothetical protein GH714_000997 [Hevea brasiliensis]